MRTELIYPAEVQRIIREGESSGRIDLNVLHGRLLELGVPSIRALDLLVALEIAFDTALLSYTPWISPKKDSSLAIIGSDGIICSTRIENACTNHTIDPLRAAIAKAATEGRTDFGVIVHCQLKSSVGKTDYLKASGSNADLLREFCTQVVVIELDVSGVVDIYKWDLVGRSAPENKKLPHASFQAPSAEQIDEKLTALGLRNLSLSQIRKLRDGAMLAAANAHCPYSSYPVGSAILTHSDQIYTAANFEIDIEALSLCAERNAAAQMASAGELKGLAADREALKAVMVYVPNEEGKEKDPATPCGGCRQVINEFAPNATIISISAKEIKIFPFAHLLPEAYGPHNMKN